MDVLSFTKFSDVNIPLTNCCTIVLSNFCGERKLIEVHSKISIQYLQFTFT